MKLSRTKRGPLFAQLRWFTQLRWVAAGVVMIGALADRRFGWYGAASSFLAVGLAIAAYNAVLSIVLHRRAGEGRRLNMLAMVQLLLDMVCLTTLVVWTGGVRSPLIAFFVFHMVFASLLLTRLAAYASAAAACVLIACGLALSQKWPQNQPDFFILCGMLVTFVLTVSLTNRITHDLRIHRRRLMRQNHRIKTMSRQLRRQQQALIQHEKMVALGQMAAGVTHEITNPLASIDSLLQLAQRNPDRMRPQAVQTLREQVARIAQIIQQMKTFAHPDDAQLQVLPLNDVVEEAIGMVRFDRRLKGVQVLREFDPGVGEAPLLPQALHQVLVNLIINALDAMADTPQPTMTIRTHRREGWCTIDVADNGHGIDPRHMSRLFEPFFTTKPLGKGTGLGLSISYSLVQKQGGSISVRSEVGKGTTFTIRLPTVRGLHRQRQRTNLGGIPCQQP